MAERKSLVWRYSCMALFVRLNAKFGPVVFYEEVADQMTLEDRVPVWAVADVMVVSSIREGVNLLPFEYVYTRQQVKSFTRQTIIILWHM